MWKQITVAALLVASLVSAYALTIGTSEPVAALNTLQNVGEIANTAECSALEAWPGGDMSLTDVPTTSKVVFDDLGSQDEQLSASHCYTEWYCYLVAVYIGNGTYITERHCESRTYCS